MFLVSKENENGSGMFSVSPASRRATLTVAGQTAVTSTCDTANRLTQV
jgi:hypothetical protein